MYLYQSTAHDLLNNYSNNVEKANGKSFASNLSVYSNNNTIKMSNSTGTSPQDDRYSCISSPAEEFSVPENFDYTQDTKPRLNLMLERFKFPVKQEGMSTLNTPDVIDEVVQMGSDFNILDLVNEVSSLKLQLFTNPLRLVLFYVVLHIQNDSKLVSSNTNANATCLSYYNHGGWILFLTSHK